MLLVDISSEAVALAGYDEIAEQEEISVDRQTDKRRPTDDKKSIAFRHLSSVGVNATITKMRSAECVQFGLSVRVSGGQKEQHGFADVTFPVYFNLPARPPSNR